MSETPPNLLQYRSDGPDDAPVLVLGPSLGTTWHMWDRQIPELTRQWRVLRFDLPGHGGAPAASAASVGDLAGRLLATLDEAGVQRFGYAGCSIGGAIGTDLALRAPHRLAALALVAASPRFGTADEFRQRGAIVRANGLEPMARSAPERWFTPGFAAAQPAIVEWAVQMVRTTDPGCYAAACEALAAFDVRTELGRVGVPTLVLVGSEDRITGPAEARTLVAGIPDARLAVVPGASHLAPVEQPAAVTDLMVRHFSSAWQPAADSATGLTAPGLAAPGPYPPAPAGYGFPPASAYGQAPVPPQAPGPYGPPAAAHPAGPVAPSAPAPRRDAQAPAPAPVEGSPPPWAASPAAPAPAETAPEGAAPEGAVPEGLAPDAAEPHAAEPHAAEPHAAEPLGAEPDGLQPAPTANPALSTAPALSTVPAPAREEPAAAVGRPDPYDAGMRVRREVLGDAHVDAATDAADDFSADFQELITRYAWGEVWTRGGLDRRTRSAVTLTALVAGGHLEELAFHTRAALRGGMTPAEIREVLIHCAVYCGVPAANAAFRVAGRVIREEAGPAAGGAPGA
ncbi:4-carboxymuconolactone decarboxylase [Streptomyces sp. ODS05-4]|uniref:4-carboxymuconolactone decarboxylase n=1 Tax=Streptomyces sp. ODS05-4 TaxID=2944939 RepID=UPI00210BB2C8|nr:4-carboxymuconolactone decarboxylase [Streptomyces sp. ODS05-4]